METVGAIRVLAISGSLRDASTNSALVRAAAQLAAPAVQVAIYRELDQLPPFNPDLDTDTRPMPVAAFRAALKSVDDVFALQP
jgi:NAD(P)H-dependent FMN reductase